jgi:hypothetical protein
MPQADLILLNSGQARGSRANLAPRLHEAATVRAAMQFRDRRFCFVDSSKAKDYCNRQAGAKPSH